MGWGGLLKDSEHEWERLPRPCRSTCIIYCKRRSMRFSAGLSSSLPLKDQRGIQEKQGEELVQGQRCEFKLKKERAIV